MDKKEYDIIVVGSGPAGLTAAIYARRAGKTVLVLESPSGEKKEFDLSIEKDTYEITQK